MNLKICVGTTCHLLGASSLIDAYEKMDPKIKKSFNMEYATCFSACQNQYTPPIISIDDQLFGNVTPETLEKILIEQLKKGE